jgi:hypothetical protein
MLAASARDPGTDFESALGAAAKFVFLLLAVGRIQTSSKEPRISEAPKSSQLAEIHSRPHHFKTFIGHAAFGAALLISCLQAGAASALSFNFSFSGSEAPNTPNSQATVTGIVSGLADNTSNQTTGLTFTITSATNTPTLGWSTFSNYGSGDGIDVSGGQVTGANIHYVNNDGQLLFLGNQGVYGAELSETSYDFVNVDLDNTSSNSLLFTPASPASVPGPLPLFGAGAAFGWSRRLRRRIKSPA